jgi:hypothetical protein
VGKGAKGVSELRGDEALFDPRVRGTSKGIGKGETNSLSLHLEDRLDETLRYERFIPTILFPGERQKLEET